MPPGLSKSNGVYQVLQRRPLLASGWRLDLGGRWAVVAWVAGAAALLAIISWAAVGGFSRAGRVDAATAAACHSVPTNPWHYDLCEPGEPIYWPPSDFCVHLTCDPRFWSPYARPAVVQCIDGTFVWYDPAACVGAHRGFRGVLLSHPGIAALLAPLAVPLLAVAAVLGARLRLRGTIAACAILLAGAILFAYQPGGWGEILRPSSNSGFALYGVIAVALAVAARVLSRKAQSPNLFKPDPWWASGLPVMAGLSAAVIAVAVGGLLLRLLYAGGLGPTGGHFDPP